jgi:hypothetical protein
MFSSKGAAVIFGDCLNGKSGLAQLVNVRSLAWPGMVDWRAATGVRRFQLAKRPCSATDQ